MRGNQFIKIAVVKQNDLEGSAVTAYAGGNVSRSVRKWPCVTVAGNADLFIGFVRVAFCRQGWARDSFLEWASRKSPSLGEGNHVIL